MSRIVIHADSSPESGTGHIARSLALGQAFLEAGASVQLACASIIETQRAAAMALGLEVVPRHQADRSSELVVIDAYDIAPDAVERLSEPSVPRLFVDDLGQDTSGATFVVNGNLYAAPGRWPWPRDGEGLFGPAYAVLAAEYRDARPHREQPPVADRILVTMGGADPVDATKAVLDAIHGNARGATVAVVIGAAHPAASARARQASSMGFTVYHAPATLEPLLSWADIVVSACGTTVLEAARLGRPLIGVVIAENQIRVASALESDELGTSIGRHPGFDANRLRDEFDRLRRDQERRVAIAGRGRLLVDGAGAKRVARAALQGPLRLRDMTLDDADKLLAWRNDPETRRNSFNTQTIERDGHVAWLRDRLADPAHRIWIGMVSGVAVGVIRFRIEGDVATISVVVGPDGRRRGVGTRLIAAGMARIASEGVAREVEAWIKLTNDPSVRAFRQAGFHQVASPEPDRLRFRSPLVRMG